MESARAAAELTVALDPDEPLAHYVLGRFHIFAGEIEMAVGDMQTTIAINPNFPLGHFGLGFAHYWGLGQAEQGLPHFDAALRLSPRDPLHWLPVSIKGSALRFLGRLDEAIAHCRQACRFPNGGFLPHMHLAAALAEAGQKDDARAAVNKAVGLEPALSIDYIRGRYIGIHETVLKSLLDSLRKAGLPEGGLPDSDQQVDAGARAAPVSTGTVSSPPALPEKPSVAVLAFDNFSDAPEQEFFADGITEDIITALSKFKGLFVIARNSSFTYKGSGTDVMRVARELGVRYVVEGSVRKAANKVRVTAQLVDGATGNHVWADRYDHESDDIFALQDEITEEIVGRLDTEVRSSEMDRARRKPPANLDAWELYQRGLWHRYKLTKEDNEEARNLFRKAVERDAAFALAHAGIARTCCAEINEGFGDTSAGWLEKGLAAGEKAVDLDDNDSYTHYALGRILVLAGQGKRAIAELEKSIALNSSNAQGYLSLGHALLWYGRAAEAIPRLDMAMRLSPYDPVLWAMQSIRATACIQLENYDEAATWAQIAVNTNPEQMWAHLNLAVALAGQERPDEARVAIEAARRLKPDLSLSVFGRLLPHFHPEYLERYNNALRKLGLPPGGPSDGAERIDEVAPAAQAPKVEGGAGQPEERPTVSDEPSIAVLPFDNMSDDAEQEYFADGIAEDIITALSKISQMRVIARNSTFSYKGRELDPRQIAEELSVRYVLKGSIRSGGSRLRITTQMIDASDGRHIWADRFDRTIDDIFDIQDEITKEIVTALRVKLTDGEEARVLARGTNDIEAWQLCVRATELFLRFNSTDYLAARELAEKAVACDPNYAYAWATLGFTHWWDGRLGYTGDSDAKFARANECAERAVALDDTVSWAIGLGTMVAGSLGRHDDGVAMGRRGFELNPGNADARAFLAVALVRAGIYHEAVDHYRAAMALNPFYPNWYRNGLVRSLSVLGEFDEALAISDEILSTDPDFLQAWLQKAYIFGQIGRSGDAEKAIREVRRLAPSLRLDHVPGLLLIKDAIDMQRFLDSLRKAGLPE